MAVSQFRRCFFRTSNSHNNTVKHPASERLEKTNLNPEFVLIRVHSWPKSLLWLNASQTNKNAACLNVSVPEVLFSNMEIHVTIPLNTLASGRLKKTSLTPNSC